MLNLKHYDLQFMPGDIAYRANDDISAVEKVLVVSASIKFTEAGVSEFYEFENVVNKVGDYSDGQNLYQNAETAFKYWT